MPVTDLLSSPACCRVVTSSREPMFQEGTPSSGHIATGMLGAIVIELSY